MKKLLMIAIVCCLAVTFVTGKPEATEKHSTEYLARHGDTIDSIVGKFYDKDQRGICWDEFRSENWKINAHLQNSRRCLQPGDLVRIEWYERKNTDGREN